MSRYNAVVITRSLRGGHYRAGQRHEAGTSAHPPKTFTLQQMEHLRADPDLEVFDLPAPPTLEIVPPADPAEGTPGEWIIPGATAEPEWGGAPAEKAAEGAGDVAGAKKAPAAKGKGKKKA